MHLKTLMPLAFTIAASTAMADTPATTGFYVSGAITHSSTSLDRGHFDSTLSGAGATGLSSSDSGSGNQWRMQLGYRYSPNLSAEVGYIDFGKAKYSAAYAGGTAQGTLKAGGVDAVGLVSLPLDNGFTIFGKAGLVAARVKSSLSSGVVDSSTSHTVVRPLIGVGASYALNKDVDLRMDFDHVSKLGSSSKTGTMGSNMISIGANYHF